MNKLTRYQNTFILLLALAPLIYLIVKDFAKAMAGAAPAQTRISDPLDVTLPEKRIMERAPAIAAVRNSTLLGDSGIKPAPVSTWRAADPWQKLEQARKASKDLADNLASKNDDLSRRLATIDGLKSGWGDFFGKTRVETWITEETARSTDNLQLGAKITEIQGLLREKKPASFAKARDELEKLQKRADLDPARVAELKRLNDSLKYKDHWKDWKPSPGPAVDRLARLDRLLRDSPPAENDEDRAEEEKHTSERIELQQVSEVEELFGTQEISAGMFEACARLLVAELKPQAEEELRKQLKQCVQRVVKRRPEVKIADARYKEVWSKDHKKLRRGWFRKLQNGAGYDFTDWPNVPPNKSSGSVRLDGTINPGEIAGNPDSPLPERIIAQFNRHWDTLSKGQLKSRANWVAFRDEVQDLSARLDEYYTRREKLSPPLEVLPIENDWWPNKIQLDDVLTVATSICEHWNVLSGYLPNDLPAGGGKR
ncbi:MAG: hypothetical protein NT069_12915 [Planctomycetota bacterium]|nr:hypothetical protein [Planctomycetota bacterium]